MILHGTSPFQQNWLYEFNIPVFSPANVGGHVLSSSIYLQVLFAMLVAGFSNSIKRTTVAMYFGKRTFVNYKDKLEALLADIVLLTEVAELSVELQNTDMDEIFSQHHDHDDYDDDDDDEVAGDAHDDNDNNKDGKHEQPSSSTRHSFQQGRMSVREGGRQINKWKGVDELLRQGPKPNHDRIEANDDDDDDDDDDNEDEAVLLEGENIVIDGSSNDDDSDAAARSIHHRGLEHNSNNNKSSRGVINFLDQWKEPVNKLDKVRARAQPVARPNCAHSCFFLL